MTDFSFKISHQLSLKANQVKNVLKLLEEGATIPFIARYRKEATGSLDEVVITEIRDLTKKLSELESRRLFILETIETQGKLTPVLKSEILKAEELHILEDLYLPYKPKRKSRASIARDWGLESLAKRIYKQVDGNPWEWAKDYINKEVKNQDGALKGAIDIIAEWVSEDKKTRDIVRYAYAHYAIINCKVSRGKKEVAIKYKDYFDWNEPLSKCPSHRFLAMARGEAEGFLKIKIEPDAERVIHRLETPLHSWKYNGCQISERGNKRKLESIITTVFSK